MKERRAANGFEAVGNDGIPEHRNMKSTSHEKHRRRKHKHGPGCSYAQGQGNQSGNSNVVEHPPPNAYEHQPRYGKSKGSKGNKGGSSAATMTVSK